MDLWQKLKLWRLLGNMVNRPFVAWGYEKTRGLISSLATTGFPDVQDDIPWAPFTKKLSDCTVGLVTTAGLYAQGQEPFDIDSKRGDPTYRVFPGDIAKKDLQVAHPHYPLARFKADANVILPLDHVRYLAQNKFIGQLTTNFYSFGFGGFLTAEYLEKPDGTSHQLAQDLMRNNADCVIFIPT